LPALALQALVLVAALLALAGCGADDSTPGQGAPATTTSTTSAPAGDDGDVDEDEVVSPTPAARAAGARFDALVHEYTPVTNRVNYLVTAETLREDAVASGAGEKVEFERFGAVRIEILRMAKVLRSARPKVAALTVTSPAQRHVQDLMLEAIDSRARALRELERALTALGAEDAPKSETEALEDRWHASWDASLRAAREATPTRQESRAMLALEPAAEDGIR
jgi:hypothetical protein